MINWLDVRNFVLVKHIALTFDTGMTVLTGETGAGKSIIVDALAILLGDRTSGSIVRKGAENAEIQAGFNLTHNSKGMDWLTEHSLIDEEECSLRRLVYKNQPSRGFINGRPVPIHYLQELGNFLVDIHSQHEHHRLLQKDNQRIILDSYAKKTSTVASIGLCFTQLKDANKKLERLVKAIRDIDLQQEFIKNQISELTMLDLDPDEIEILENKQKRITHSVELAEKTWGAIQILDETEDISVLAIINKLLQNLKSISDHDHRLNDIFDQLQHIVTNVEDIVLELRKCHSEYDTGLEELNAVQERISLLYQASRKYRVQPKELQTKLEELNTQLETTTSQQDKIKNLKNEIIAMENTYDSLSKEITHARESSRNALAATITNNLNELGLADSIFEIDLMPIKEKYGKHGNETVGFSIRPNLNSEPGPIGKIASGGELSRISLAIQVATTNSESSTCSIYDEVDVGVGGRTAEIVGSKLKKIAQNKQVICITHLPQVAVQGQSHIQIKKLSSDESEIYVNNLDFDQRLEEISRMLGGVEITAETRAHAADMLKRAGN